MKMTKEAQEVRSRYWGLGATIAFSLVILLTFFVIQTMAFFIYAERQFAEQATTDKVAFLNALLSNGDAISIAEIPATIAGIVVTFFFIWLHRQQSIENYLHLSAVKYKVLFQYIGIMLVTIALLSFLSVLTDHPTPQVMLDLYHSAKHPELLWFAVIIAAPFFEEILFRGFLFEGLRHSSLGFVGAAIVTSALWASIHLQYALYEIVIIFLVGLLLAYAKAKTGSLYIPIAMHSLMNLTATLEIELNLV
jgi:membrane protease YdiL (CAAX protease family)